MNIFKKAITEAKELDKTVESFKETPEPEEEWIWVEGYKGTDKDMCCRGYQYELGKRYDMPEGEEIEECESGFHLCLSLPDVFYYYPVCYSNRFFKVKALVRKSDKARYGATKNYYDDYGNVVYTCSAHNKLAAKSIIFQSELTVDEICQYTEVSDLPEEYKQAAIEYGVEFAITNYKINTLIEDGYSQAFAAHLVKYDKFDFAHAIGSQKDLSMDMKVLAILYNTKENK
jgi:hypothetical protein